MNIDDRIKESSYAKAFIFSLLCLFLFLNRDKIREQYSRFNENFISKKIGSDYVIKQKNCVSNMTDVTELYFYDNLTNKPDRFPETSNMTNVMTLYLAWYSCNGMTNDFPLTKATAELILLKEREFLERETQNIGVVW